MDDYNTESYASNSTFNNSSPSESLLIYSYGERIFVAVCWLLITIIGTAGNSMVIFAVLLSRKLRTITNVFVINLAIADLLTCLFLIWGVVALLSIDGWPLPRAKWLCATGGFMIFTCTGASLYNLAAIGFNRLCLITFSFARYKNIYKPCNVAIMITMTWLIPFSVMFSLPLAGIGGFGYDQHHPSCSDLDLHPKSQTFHLAQTITSYPVPLVTIIISYVLVFRHIRRHFNTQRLNEMKNITPASSSGVSSGSTSGKDSTNDVEAVIIDHTSSNRTQRINKTELDITKNLFLAVCIFFLFFSPYFVALLIPESDYFLLYGATIVLANSTINPVIYARHHPHFKTVFRCMVTCKYAEIPEPSNILKRILSYTA